MFKIIRLFILLIIFSGLYFYRDDLKSYINNSSYKTTTPNIEIKNQNIESIVNKISNITDTPPQKVASRCDKPISYNIGNFDPRFNISEVDFIKAVKEAENIWEKEVNKNLFEYDQINGSMSINLIYDYRQETLDKMKEIGIIVDQNRESYEEIKNKYTESVSLYTQLKSKYDQKISDFNKKSKEYESQVKYWNNQGGAPKEEYDKLTSQKINLDRELVELKNDSTNINKIVDQINGLANTLNRLVEVLNLNVNNYNTIGETLGENFEEGLYTQDGEFKSIDIYEYQNTEQLVRVLAHELGHALGIGHLDNKDALMHYLNVNTSTELTIDDKNALASICGLVY